MLKVILGSALGGLVAGGIALFAAGQAPNETTVTPAADVPQSQVVAPAPQAAPAQLVPVAQPAPPPRPARQVVYRDRSDDVVRYEPDVKRRSVAKTAMVIGGSAGAGAGVGALVGGKKGALIGAALGGGAASIYEATKR